MTATRTSTRLLVAVGLLALTAGACSSDSDTKTTTAVTTPATVPAGETTVASETTVGGDTSTSVNGFTGALTGMFGIDAGACDGTAVTGSYFRMMQPDKNFIPNADSSCADTTYSLLAAGTDGGLQAGEFQAAPDPAFDATGSGLADKIVMPVKFFGVNFAVATDPTGTAPTITESNGLLVGDLSAFTAYYGTGVFNQGAPKPDGSGDAAMGTIDASTGHFIIEWTSLISGGSFDGFTGVWHLEGTFTPAG